MSNDNSKLNQLAELLREENERFSRESSVLGSELEASGHRLRAIAEKIVHESDSLEEGLLAQIDHLTAEYLNDVRGI